MTVSYTHAHTTTFTLTHAKHMAAKVATDLKRIQRLYGYPSDSSIAAYEAEAIQLLKEGYLERVTYGFRRNGDWIEPTVRYTSRELATDSANDDDPGRIRANADIRGASFYSYLTYSATWGRLSSAQQDEFKKSRLPFVRGGAPEPGIAGYLSQDRTYSSGGRALDRATVRSY